MKQILLLLLLPCFLKAQTNSEDTKAYAAFDFIAGDKIVYINHFEKEIKGELPTGWNTNGSCEVVTINNNNWVKLLQNATFITDNTKPFSGNFTVEFDLILKFTGTNAMFPQVSFGILSSGNNKPNSNATLQQLFQHKLAAVDLYAGIENNSITKLISFQNGSEYFNSGEKPFKLLETLLGTTMHISMQVQQQRFRVWVNEHKLFDVPQALPEKSAINQLFFRVFESSYTNDQIGIYVSNISVAQGLADTRHKILTEGKFSTTGILFDVNTATIKPVSYGVLKEIGSLLKANDSLRIRIVGHTDADGSEADNLTLSQQRSAAVKQFLVKEYGISPQQLFTDGLGESKPVADNTSKEGKAQNRRVEFIKL